MQSPERPTRPPHRPLPVFTKFLIPILFAGGALLSQLQGPSGSRDQSMTGGGANTTPQPTPTSALEPSATPTAKPSSTPHTGMSTPDEHAVMLVPGEDGMLHRRPVPSLGIKSTEMPTAPSTYTRLIITNALEKLFRSVPQYFPKGAHVNDVTIPDAPDKPIIVDMRKGFDSEDFWQGEETTTTSLYAIVNTVAANSDKDSSNQAVLFHIEGKPIVTLGQMDMRDALTADPSLVAKP